MKKIISLLFAVILIIATASCNQNESASSDASLPDVSLTTDNSSEKYSSQQTSSENTELTVESILATTSESDLNIPNYTLPSSTTNLPQQTDPDSAFLYGGTLPQGHYVLMSFIGNQYALYDESGHLVKIFRYVSYEEPINNAMVLPLSAVHDYTDPNQVEYVELDTDPDDLTYYNDFPGGYVKSTTEAQLDQTEDARDGLTLPDDENKYVTFYYIYNSNHELLFTYQEPDFTYSIYRVDSNEKESAVFIQTEDYKSSTFRMDAYIVTREGALISKYEFKNLPAKPIQIISEEYIITGSYDGPRDIYNRSGELVMSDVEPIDGGHSVFSDQAYMFVNIYGYFSKDGLIYDANLNQVQAGSVDSNGQMIPGMIYDVNGIPCTAMPISSGWTPGEDYQIVAVGKQDNRTAIRTSFGEYEIISDNGTYDISNHHIVIMNENETYKMYDLKSGKYLVTLKNRPDYVANDYVILTDYDQDSDMSTYTVIDKEGKTRLVTNGESLLATNGEYVYMIRGPYQGIADLDGNWLIRNLTWESSRDAPYENDY